MSAQNYWTAGFAATSLASVGFGLNALIRPNSFFDVIGVSPPKDPDARRLAKAQILMYGARDLSLGTACLATWYLDDRRTMGALMFAGMPIAIVDWYAAQTAAGKSEWFHWIFVPVLAAVGAGCLGWI